MRILTMIAALLVPLVSSAQNFSSGLIYDPGHKETSVVAVSRGQQFTNVFGTKYSLSLDPFLGYNLANDNAVGGVLLDYWFKAADQAQAFAGVGMFVQDKRPIGWGISFGVRF